MSLFRKAEASKKGLKVLAYGDSGVGKTTFALTFPQIAAIDSETGMSHYENNPNLVFISNTNSAYDVEDAIVEIEDSYLSEIKTFLIDSETKVYDNMQVSAMEVEEKRAKRKGGEIEDSTVSVRGWGRIKLINKRLQNLKISLSSKGINIVSIAQVEDVKEKRGENFVKVGEKPNMAKGVQFDYDIVLKLFTEKTSGGNDEVYKAVVEKDRTSVFKKGDIIENPSFDYWKDYYENNNKLKEVVVDFNKDLQKDMSRMEDETDQIEALVEEFKKKIKVLAKDKQMKVQGFLKEKGIDNPLKTDKAEEMKEVLEFMDLL